MGNLGCQHVHITFAILPYELYFNYHYHYHYQLLQLTRQSLPFPKISLCLSISSYLLSLRLSHIVSLFPCIDYSHFHPACFAVAPLASSQEQGGIHAEDLIERALFSFITYCYLDHFGFWIHSPSEECFQVLKQSRSPPVILSLPELHTYICSHTSVSFLHIPNRLSTRQPT